jgi:hypothetical protein
LGMVSPDHFINLAMWHHGACTPRQVLIGGNVGRNQASHFPGGSLAK